MLKNLSPIKLKLKLKLCNFLFRIFHPKIQHPSIVNAMFSDWSVSLFQNFYLVIFFHYSNRVPVSDFFFFFNAMFSIFKISVRIIEAQDLAGVSLDPSVTITLGEMEKKTTVKKQTNNPSWDEVFINYIF